MAREAPAALPAAGDQDIPGAVSVDGSNPPLTCGAVLVGRR